MIDFHSHILPGMDDGSQSVEMSLQMLEAQSRQGIDTVIATSHFYADHHSPSQFLAKREKAWESLKASLPENSPRILLGAEVLYFPGISRSEELDGLCTEGTNILLLEMPFIHWLDRMVRDVIDLARTGKYSILMAHIERYYFQQDVSVWDEFLEEGIHMQSNAEFFLRFGSRHRALKLLREERIHVLGTDCHNMDSRAPRMGEAVNIIRKRLGEETVAEMDSFGHTFLEGAAL